jgi:ribosome maturation factor RimP
MNALTERIAALIEPSLAGLGYDLVRVQVDGKRQARIQVMAERRGGGRITVEDCAAISRAVSALLDVEDPVEGAYALEVSSPGIDRPLVRPDDYRRFAGQVARIELKAPIEGRRRFTGTLLGTEADAVAIDLGGGLVARLPIEQIDRAKLVLTDSLIASTRPETA